MILQGSDEWKMQRLGRVTASRAADVLAKLKSGGEASTRKNYRAELVVERLVGQPSEGYENEFMRWGRDTEPLARLSYKLKTGLDVAEAEFFGHPSLMAGASPDGLVGDDGLIEVKSRTTANHIAVLRLGKAPAEYLPQIQMQLWITERRWCDFVSFDPRLPERNQIFIQRIERDEPFIEMLTNEVGEFLLEVDAEIKFLEGYGE